MSDPARRVGRSSDIARWLEKWGERPEPGGERLLTVGKAPWARLRGLEKCADQEMLGVNQYPSHVTQEREEKVWLSRYIGGAEGAPGGFLCRGVLQ